MKIIITHNRNIIIFLEMYITEWPWMPFTMAGSKLDSKVA